MLSRSGAHRRAKTLPKQRAGAKGSPVGRLTERGALQGSRLCKPESLPGNPGCNYQGAQPRGSEKKQITVQAPSVLIKILSPAKPPTPAQPVPISSAGQGEQRAGLRLMKRKHCRAFKCWGRQAAPARTARGPGKCDRRPCRWLAMAKQMRRVTGRQSRCFTASSRLEWPWDCSWGNAVKPTAPSEVLSIRAQQVRRWEAAIPL